MLLLLSCGLSAPSDPDQRLHAQALESGANADCAEIVDSGLRGDCESWRAGKLARTDALAAESACEDIEPDLWREECWFLLSDNVESMGSEAERLCAQTGRFQRECHSHAIQREAELWLREPGEEMQAFAGLEAHFGLSYPPQEARAEALRALTSELLRRPRPFTPSSFGDASEEVVVFTLSEHLRFQRCSARGMAPTLDPALVAQAKAQAGCPMPLDPRG